MNTYDLTDFQSYQDYFANIADKHPKLKTGTPGASFIFGDADVPLTEGKVWKGKKLWLEPYQPVKVSDPKSDNYLKEKRGSLWIGGAPVSKKFADKHALYHECEKIVEDIISKIIHDRNEGVLVTSPTTITYGMGEFDFSATAMVGCRFDFTYFDPTGFTYDENNWL